MIPIQHHHNTLLILADIPDRPTNRMASRIRGNGNPMRQDGGLTIPQRRDFIKCAVNVLWREEFKRLVVLLDSGDRGSRRSDFEGREAAERGDWDGGVGLGVGVSEQDPWESIDVCGRAVGKEDEVELGRQVGRREPVCSRCVEEDVDRVKGQQQTVVRQLRQRRQLQHRVPANPHPMSFH